MEEFHSHMEHTKPSAEVDEMSALKVVQWLAKRDDLACGSLLLACGCCHRQKVSVWTIVIMMTDFIDDVFEYLCPSSLRTWWDIIFSWAAMSSCEEIYNCSIKKELIIDGRVKRLDEVVQPAMPCHGMTAVAVGVSNRSMVDEP
jgi:hypothetical protein